MTRQASNYRDRRRELERELADIPAPPPPADLLDAIRSEIPDDLTVAGEPTPAPPLAPATNRPGWRSPALRLAASLAFVAVGAAVVLHLTDDTDRRRFRLAEAPAGAVTETAPVLRGGSPRLEREQAAGKRENEPGAGHSTDGEPRVSALTDLGYVGRARRPGVAGESKEIPEPVAPSRGEWQMALPPPAGAAPAAPAEQITVSSEAPFVDKYNTTAGNEEALRVQGGVVARSGGVAILNSNSTVPSDYVPRSDKDRRVGPSSSATTAPNDAAADDMFFRSTGVNPFVDTREDALSTFALDVDTGSWSLSRSYLDRGSLPPAEAIRVEEFVNAQDYDDPAPRRGEFTLVAEGAPSPFAPAGDYRLLRFAVKGRELAAGDRKPAVLTFVVDVSGSMNRENRIGLVKRALGLLLDELAFEDRVGLVIYGTRGRVVLEHTSDHERIRRAIESLSPEGSTNAEEGLRLGYELAGAAYRSGWNNRVVLCSDGVANVGATGPESILERIGSEARRGIELTTVGFGMGNYNDALMEQLADQGDGRYHYVDTLEEARRIFVENLSGTIETIAMDAKVQVELDPEAVERWRLLGYENRDVADRDFRNDHVDAGEIGAGHSATALYEIRLAPGARRNDPIGTLRLRWKSVATGSVEEASLTLRVRDLDASFADASPNLRRAAVAAELAEMLKHSYYAQEASWRTLRAEARRLDDELVSGRQADALFGIIDRASALAGERTEEIEH